MLSRATARDRVVLERLLQLYQYDFSEIVDEDIGGDGRFSHLPLDAFFRDSEDACAYLAHVGNALAGFALVMRQRSRTRGEGLVWWMAEFFVLRRHRRRGTGDRMATGVLRKHPGDWEVAQIVENQGAQAFWRSVIDRFTGGSYEEVFVDDRSWRGPIQRFQV